jgi:F-type H+-transporting ATPase subunit b
MLAWLTVALAAVPETVEKKSGLPQLNPHDMMPQIIWLALVFGVLYLVLSRLTLPRIESVIEERQNRIQRDLDEAERLKGDTEKAIAAYEQSLAEARGNANALARETRDKLATEVDQERAKVEADLAAKQAEAEARIDTMKNEAMSNVDAIASETAGEVVKKLIGVDVSVDDVRAAMQASRGE